MPRPHKARRVEGVPLAFAFKPAGRKGRTLEHVELSLDEWEAIRLADYHSLYHEDAAQRMQVSRQTFGNIVTSARNKIAQALVEGKMLVIHNRLPGG
jgi:predicted DNA-binding protein (UPF0251 family)